MKRKAPALVVLVACTLLAVGLAPVAATQPEEQSLVQIVWQTDADLTQVEALKVPVYAHLSGVDGPYLLAGVEPQVAKDLRSRGISVAILDTNLRGASYYLAYTTQVYPNPDWKAYGRLLLDDGLRVLLQMSSRDAERLAQVGVELEALTFDPKPLRPARAGAAIPVEVAADPYIQEMIDAVDSGTMMDYANGLSGEVAVEIGGQPYVISTRHTNSGTPVQKATQYVGEHMEALGLDVEYHNWAVGSYTNRNVIGELQGETNPEEIFIICAHLDDMPSGPVAPGADDNASGSVAVLAAADILTQYRWGCTLRFAFWTGEEQGLLGSYRYAQRSYATHENIIGVLNLDMIAWDAVGDPDIDLHANSSIPATLDLGNLFSNVVSTYGLDLAPEVIRNGIGASDHASFWQYGYTSILGIEEWDDFNDYYHTTNDKVLYYNKNYFVEFVKASVGTFAHMSDCLIRPRFYYMPLVMKSGGVER